MTFTDKSRVSSLGIDVKNLLGTTIMLSEFYPSYTNLMVMNYENKMQIKTNQKTSRKLGGFKIEGSSMIKAPRVIGFTNSPYDFPN